eukprot:364615-Chlamydomonas_euryale.AAC.59
MEPGAAYCAAVASIPCAGPHLNRLQRHRRVAVADGLSNRNVRDARHRCNVASLHLLHWHLCKVAVHVQLADLRRAHLG